MLFAILIYEKGNLYKRQSRIWLCIAVFVLNGLVSIISKSHQITPLNTVDSVIFVMYSGVAKFVISSVMLLVVGKKATSFAFNFKSSGYIIALSAIVGGVSYLLQLIGAKGLPASVLYPLVTGGNIIFSSIAGRVFFKDKLTLHQIISVLLCFTGTFLFL